METPKPPQLWPEEGECFRYADPEIFYPDSEKTAEGRAKVEAAKKYCQNCRMADYCLKWAIYNGEQGIWGNTTESERRAIIARQKRNAKNAA